MSTLIRIDRSTFRRNPKAGNTTTVMPGLVSMRATFSDESGDYILSGGDDGEFYVVESNTRAAPRFAVGAAYPYTAFTDGTLIPEMSRDVAVLHHMPEPDWLYKREPTPINCSECGETFDAKELTSDDCGDAVSFAVCPKCGSWECCDVEYESPDDVARELGLTPT